MNGGKGRLIAGLSALPLDLIRAAVLLSVFGSALVGVLAIGGRFSRLLDAPAHLALAGLALSLVMLLAALLTSTGHSRTPVVLGLVGVVAWSVLVNPEYASALSAKMAAPGGDSIKVVQFNLWSSNADHAVTADWILKQDADVVAVEEVSVNSYGVLRRLKAQYPFMVGCSDPSPCSTMILTKTAPIASGGQTSPFGPANLVWVKMAGSGGEFTLVGAHHSWPYPAADQPSQVSWTADVLKTFDRDSLIVAGDFNSTPWSASLRRQDKLFDLHRVTRALPTFPARTFARRPIAFPVPFLPLDHVYTGKAWQAVSVKRGPRLGSDHYPVVVVLRRIEVAAQSR